MKTQTPDIRKIAAEVRDRITGWPATYDQEAWLYQPGSAAVDRALFRSVEDWAECGAVACVAGHIAAVVARDHPELIVRSAKREADTAMSVMGVSGEPFAWPFAPARTLREVLEWLTCVADGENPKAAADRLKLNV